MLKHLLLSTAFAAMAIGASAQYHGFSYLANEDVAGIESEGSNQEIINAYFDTNYVPTVKVGETLQSSTWGFVGNKWINLIDGQERALENAELLHGAFIETTFENGMLYAEIPSVMTYPSSSNFDGKGSLVFHFMFPSSGYRINDKKGELDNCWNNAYLKDCNGVYLGVDAPEGAEFTVYLSTPAGPNGYTYQGYTKEPMAASFSFPVKGEGKYGEFTSTSEIGGCDAVMNFTQDGNWVYGYCCKYVDVVISGVKAGDKVGFRGIQTLHPGYTPEVMAGVEDITVDNTNAPVEYFNLQGIRVENPANGLYIRRQGNEVTKVVL